MANGQRVPVLQALNDEKKPKNKRVHSRSAPPRAGTSIWTPLVPFLLIIFRNPIRFWGACGGPPPTAEEVHFHLDSALAAAPVVVLPLLLVGVKPFKESDRRQPAKFGGTFEKSSPLEMHITNIATYNDAIYN